MDGHEWLNVVIEQFRSSKRLSERALEQVADADFFREPTEGVNSLGCIVKHMGGNLHSRWRDFLTSDGEKPDRQRESEFVIDGESRTEVTDIWAGGWKTLLGTLESLHPDDLGRTITIRQEPIRVVPAIHRGLAHANYHTGQIVLLARQWSGAGWKSLSISRGESDAFLDKMKSRFNPRG